MSENLLSIAKCILEQSKALLFVQNIICYFTYVVCNVFRSILDCIHRFHFYTGHVRRNVYRTVFDRISFRSNRRGICKYNYALYLTDRARYECRLYFHFHLTAGTTNNKDYPRRETIRFYYVNRAGYSEKLRKCS